MKPITNKLDYPVNGYFLDISYGLYPTIYIFKRKDKDIKCVYQINGKYGNFHGVQVINIDDNNTTRYPFDSYYKNFGDKGDKFSLSYDEVLTHIVMEVI